MKKLLLSIIASAFLLPFIANSQNSHLHQFYKTQDNWLLDSIFERENSETKDKYITRIKARNEYSLPLIEELQSFNDESQEYDILFYIEYNYPLENDTTEYSYIWDYNYNGFEDKKRYFFNYDDNGYITTSEEHWHNTSWDFGEMKKSKYSNEHQTFEFLTYRRHNENQDWKLFKSRIGFYNEDSTLIIRYNFDIENNIYDTTKKEYQFINENGLWIGFESYEKTNDIWVLKRKTTSSYNENKQLIMYESFKHDDGILINDYKQYYSYDQNNYLSLKTTYEWDKNDSIWEYEDQYSYLNDSNGNIISTIKYDDIEDTIWVEDHKWEYVYDESNKILNEEKYSINEDSIWFPRTYKTYTYHNGIKASFLYQVWDNDLNSYRDHDSYEYEFDEFDRVISHKIFHADTASFILELKALDTYSYLENENQLLKTSISIFVEDNDTVSIKREYYNKYITGVNELKPNEFKIFPNPTTGRLVLSSDHYNSQNIKFEILNTSMQVIKTGIINASGIININQLSSGFYLLKVIKPNNQEEIIKFQKI